MDATKYLQTRQAFIRNYVPDKNFWIKRLQLHLDMNESVQKGDKKLSRDILSVRVHNQFGTHCIANIYTLQYTVNGSFSMGYISIQFWKGPIVIRQYFQT